MAGLDAFSGSVERRERLLADLRAKGALATLWLQGSDKACDLVAEEYMLDRALVRLISAFATAPMDAAADFAVQMLLAIPLDRPTAGRARAWLLDRWQHGLASRFVGSAAEAPARAIIDLVERSHTETVDAASWRRAGRALSLADELPPEVEEYADVVAAAAWGLDGMPGAIGDVVQAWRLAVRWDVLRASGWTREKQQAFEAASVMHQVAAAQALASHDRTDATFPQIFQATVAELFEQAGQKALLSEAEVAFAAAGKRIAAWEGEERNYLLKWIGCGSDGAGATAG